MSKKKYIFCVLVSIISCSFAQPVKYYSINIAKDFKGLYYYNLDISLCEDDRYNIYLISDNSCSIGSVMWHYYISEGIYKIKNDTLILTDLYTNHKVIYKFDNPYLYPVKTFPFMMDKVFIDYGQIFSAMCKNIRNDFLTEEKVSAFKRENSQENPLEKGIYWFSKWTIELSDNEKYELRLQNLHLDDSTFDLLLFTGTWRRDGNILLLWDTNFEHQFYGLIREDGIELLGFSFFDDPVFKKE